MTVNHLHSEIPEAGMGVSQHGADFFSGVSFFVFTSRKCQKATEPVLFK